MQYIFWIIIFLFGAALGSFIAVISDRYNTGLSFLKGRSICSSCNTELQKKDLIPIFSFLLLRGKCHYCQSKIPKEALIIEILMGILTVLAFSKSGLSLDFILVVAIFGNILFISVYDLKHFIIPDSFLISFFVLSFLYLILNTLYSIPTFLFSGLVLASPFLFIFLISKGTWFGFGDVKYIAVLGFFLGFTVGLSAIVLSFWIGAAFSLSALFLKRLKPHINLPLLHNNFTIKSEIPFGPFLSLGIIISFYLSLDLFQIHALFF
jgi:prepilin signal peptidase PulO-like enzyme (type II secretory pathway)